MKPMCKYNLDICCLDCVHSEPMEYEIKTLVCTFDGQYCGFGNGVHNDCSECQYNEDNPSEKN